MSATAHIPAEALDKQAKAADPAVSAWVSAHAGSGKTHVLARRVIRLLLEGVEPSKILCLTYTKAAAANMANRVFRELARWTVIDEAVLGGEIAGLEKRHPGEAKLRLARQLFARALETPGGLKIQTIHAFCEAVLHQFPLEANIAGHFEILDPVMERSLVAEARRDLLTATGAADDPELGQAFATVLDLGGEAGLDALLGEIVARRADLRAFIGQAGPAGVGPLLREELELGPEETEASIAAAAFPPPGFDAAYFARMAEEAERCDAAQVLSRIVPHGGEAYRLRDPARALEQAARGFLTDKGAPYAATTFKKALLAAMPDLPERYAAAAETIRAGMERLATLRMAEATACAMVVADRLIARYERLKNARGFLDFDDLIRRTVSLLARQDAAAWVQYKLDRGIDHILVDEAQDTSPDQWHVVRSLAGEFFAGAGQRDDVHRTIFAVGDEKQSIYSFQGAEPAAFAESGRLFAGRVGGVGRNFAHVRLQHSFRSTEDVLAVVDRVFLDPDTRRGLTQDDVPIEHKAIRAGLPGSVELWPSVGPDAVDRPDDWTAPIDVTSAPAVRLANRIAATVSQWIERGETIEGRGRPLRPGDVMVLVRRRDSFVHALSRAMKAAQPAVAVAGADRLRLESHIATRDLLAIARFALQPDDDLSLAALLRSPVFGLSDDDLYGLARERGAGVSLEGALRRDAARDGRLAAILGELDRWRGEAHFLKPFDFFSGILGRDGVQRRLAARLGRDSVEILDEFLNFCLAEERTGLPGLESFVATLENAGPEIRRETDQARDEVRIMTVHAAKGLEAPVVFLVDDGAAPFSTSHLPRLLPLASMHGAWRGKGFLWRVGGLANPGSKAVENRIAEAAREEYRRLLYVGMTRAEDRLIVCGYHGAKPAKDAKWHAMVQSALDASPETRDVGTDEAPARRFRIPGARRVPDPEPTSPAGSAAPTGPLPSALSRPAAPALPLPRTLAPSGAVLSVDQQAEAGLLSPVSDGGTLPGFAAQRGTAIHRLLQALPDVAAGDRAAVATAHLARVGSSWSEAQRADAWRSVERILADPDFSVLFAEGSRAEVSVMGRLTVGRQERSVSGKIDRLAILPDRVVIADYKTTRPVPSGSHDLPASHVAQMAIYSALVSSIFPGRRVEAALVYTDAPVIVTLPPTLLADALEALDPS
jgi:ATP-dependent helicase/nuclease subunit A